MFYNDSALRFINEKCSHLANQDLGSSLFWLIEMVGSKATSANVDIVWLPVASAAWP